MCECVHTHVRTQTDARTRSENVLTIIFPLHESVASPLEKVSNNHQMYYREMYKYVEMLSLNHSTKHLQ